MFSSRCLANKEPLRIIWVAAYFQKKLKKAQITETDIVSTVDKMLQDDFGVVTYRVLAYLLLGVVRIQSKKVEYMFDDCNKFLSSINEFVSKKESSHTSTLSALYDAIILPNSFELDAFELDILEDSNGNNVMPNEAITLKDTAGLNEGMLQFCLDKYQCELNASSRDTCFLDDHPAEDALSSRTMNIGLGIGSSRNLIDLEASLEKLRDIRFSQEDCLNFEKFYGIEEEPPVLAEPLDEDHQSDTEEMEVGQLSDFGARSDMDMSTGELGDCQFSPEHCLNRNETYNGFREKPAELVEPLGKDHQNNEGQRVTLLQNDMCQLTEDDTYSSSLQASIEKLQNISFSQEEFPEPGIFYRAEKTPGTVRELDEENQSNALQINDLEMTSSQEIRCQISTGDQPPSSTHDSTPVSNFPDHSDPGRTTPKFMVLETPAVQKRKRKCIIDDSVMLSNKVIKKRIEDSSNLVSKGRKVPNNALAAWKVQKISSLPDSFLEPLLTCPALELRSLFSQRKLEITESIEVVKDLEEFPECTENVEATEKIPEYVETVESPRQSNVSESLLIGGFIEETQIAPETPIQQTSSVRSIETAKESYSDGFRPVSLCGSAENDTTPSENQELDINLMDEEISSRYKDNQLDVSSGSTSIVSFLHQRTEEETVNLSQALTGKNKKDSATLFYEILVLKSKGYIDVGQDCAYGDIHVRRLPKLVEL